MGSNSTSKRGCNATTPIWYDSTTGNWITQDPLGFAAGDSNISRYVNNAPTDAADPSGTLERVFTAVYQRGKILRKKDNFLTGEITISVAVNYDAEKNVATIALKYRADARANPEDTHEHWKKAIENPPEMRPITPNEDPVFFVKNAAKDGPGPPATGTTSCRKKKVGRHFRVRRAVRR